MQGQQQRFRTILLGGFTALGAVMDSVAADPAVTGVAASPMELMHRAVTGSAAVAAATAAPSESSGVSSMTWLSRSTEISGSIGKVTPSQMP